MYLFYIYSHTCKNIRKQTFSTDARTDSKVVIQWVPKNLTKEACSSIGDRHTCRFAGYMYVYRCIHTHIRMHI